MYPQVFGKYVLERELSRGGMARVILATLRGAGGFEKKLVVKQIRDELAYDQVFIQRFVEEAKTTVALSHPNIVPVYELGVEQGTYFLAMELVEGVSIADLLRERNEDGTRRVLTPEEGAYIGVEVCRALDYAHRRMKVVHRDITPRNVMIDEEGQVKLIDFGIAAPALLAGQEILGSPGHMAPEQVSGAELGPPTDIFALAVLLLEAWTGTPPFRRVTPEECEEAMRAPHPRPSDFDTRLAPLDGAMRRAMHLDPKARQQEASDLARELRAFLQNVDTADVARALGDRVRGVRDESVFASPESRRDAPRPSAASHGELGTKTFAARDEALGWSHPSDEAAEPMVPSTRRIDSENRVDLASDPVMSVPTPLMVDVEELERIHSEIKQSDVPTVRKLRYRVPDGTNDTIATKPLETPVRAHEPPRDRRMLGGVAIAGLFAVGAFFVWRTQHEVRQEPAQITSATPTIPQPPLSAVVVPPPSAEVPSALVTALVKPPQSPPSSSPSGSAAVAAGRANVALLGDPGTRVSIDGAARGACPVRLVLEPGSHEVRFTFDPTGESRGERFTVKSGEHVTVRAEFTGATPTVKIQR